MEKVLSIIIPTYNMERYLRKCLDSLIVSDGNMQLLEVLIINDGSKDSSSQIAHEYETKYPQTFLVIDKENGNYGSCVNRGLKKATGRFVKILDADDSFTDVFDSFVTFLKDQTSDLIICDFDIVEENGLTIMPVRYTSLESDSISLSHLSKKESTYLWHHAITYKLDLFDKFEYKQTEGISYSDEEWVFEPMTYIKNVSYFHKTLYLYLRGREGQTYDPEVRRKSRSQMDIILNNLIRFYNQNRDKIFDSGAALFMHDRIKMGLTDIYRFYLFEQPSLDGYKIISDFDQQLKNTNVFLYEEMANYLFRPKLHFYYVKRWRKVNYDHGDFELSFFRYLCKIYDFVKKLKH